MDKRFHVEDWKLNLVQKYFKGNLNKEEYIEKENSSKDKDIVKVGYIKRSGILSGGYDICEWATRTWVSDNCPGWEEGQPLIIDSEGNVQTNDLIRRN